MTNDNGIRRRSANASVAPAPTRTIPVHTYRLRVVHLAASWPELLTRLPVVLDMFANATEDGSSSVRSVRQTVAALGEAGVQVSEPTVKRHRAWAVRVGLAVVAHRGGRHAAATVYATALPEQHRSRARVNMIPAPDCEATPEHGSPASVNVIPAGTEHGSSTDQARITPERAADTPCIRVVEASKQQPQEPASDPTPVVGAISGTPAKQLAGETAEHAAARWLASTAETTDLAASLHVVRHYGDKKRGRQSLQEWLRSCWNRDAAEVLQNLEHYASKQAVEPFIGWPEHLEDRPMKEQQAWMRQQRQRQRQQYQRDCARRAGFRVT